MSTARTVLLALCLALAGSAAADDTPPWDRVRAGGHVVLLRHALAPGTGDPAGFELGDCGTQRNLSAGGRAQARRIGERLREAGLGEAPVFTSQWCRCRDTARLLGLTEPRDLPALNSFYGPHHDRDSRMRLLREFLRGRAEAPTAVLVTHQVTITAATGVYPRSGEAVVARVEPDGSLTRVGLIPAPSTGTQ